ncbi:MAG: hypothetical protein ACRDX8_14090, partial [Acidimicrobiales bacterium]
SVVRSLEQRRAPRAPTDPKEAILAAVANLEEHLEQTRGSRPAEESTTEFLRRVLPRDSWSSRPCRRLVSLYWAARYSQHGLVGADAAAAERYVRLLARADGAEGD